MALPQSSPNPDPEEGRRLSTATRGLSASAGAMRPRYHATRTSARPSARVAPILWALLAVALVFMATVQILLRSSANAPAPVPHEDTATLWSQSPSHVASPALLRLDWQPADGAVEYRLRFTTAAGRIIVEELRVLETAWAPPHELLPALAADEYVWQVEAVGEEGETLARSSPMSVRIGM